MLNRAKLRPRPSSKNHLGVNERRNGGAKEEFDTIQRIPTARASKCDIKLTYKYDNSESWPKLVVVQIHRRTRVSTAYSQSSSRRFTQRRHQTQKSSKLGMNPKYREHRSSNTSYWHILPSVPLYITMQCNTAGSQCAGEASMIHTPYANVARWRTEHLRSKNGDTLGRFLSGRT